MASEPTVEQIQHWAAYGRQGEPPAARVTMDAWKTKPMRHPIVAPWSLAVPRPALERLLLGFRPREMEDKWFVCATGPDAWGNVVVGFWRSWTGYQMAEVRIKVPLAAVPPPAAPAGDDKGGTTSGQLDMDGARVTEVVFEVDRSRHKSQTAEGAKDMVRSCCEWILQVKLPDE